MASSPCCAAGKPVHHDHKPLGSFVQVKGMDVYQTGSGPNVLLVVYDIFGFKFNQVLQVCDRLAEAGFTVAAPDFFRYVQHAAWPLGPLHIVILWKYFSRILLIVFMTRCLCPRRPMHLN